MYHQSLSCQTSCSKNLQARVRSLLFLTDRLINWKLLPQNSTEIAFGYRGLIVAVQLHYSTSLSCAWVYDGELRDKLFLTNGFCPSAVLYGERDEVICGTNEARDLISQLKLNSPLQLGLFSVALQCNNVVYFKSDIHISCKYLVYVLWAILEEPASKLAN